ncbi:ABC transporter permease [Kiritimatiellaeota bacterium B1221]|nr:ABC transporter permease [Kiritimatiellaeota bacterium B1221]
MKIVSTLSVARTVWLEALRRRDIYAIVIISCVLMAVVMGLDFFHLEGLNKFYREFALKFMSTATAITVIVLSARQLPREFENRTIYPLLARPLSRFEFLLGKFLGVWLTALFCFGLFMVVFLLGMAYLQTNLQWAVFLQYLYLQTMMMGVLAAMGFVLSMLCNIDAAIAFGSLLFLFGSTMASMMNTVYELSTPVAQWMLIGLTWFIPQLFLFDLSEKTVHADIWPPVSFEVMAALTLYALLFITVYFTGALLLFRRKGL